MRFEDGGSSFLRNVGTYLLDYAVAHPRRPLCENQASVAIDQHLSKTPCTRRRKKKYVECCLRLNVECHME
jgi:hypothetical protein